MADKRIDNLIEKMESNLTRIQEAKDSMYLIEGEIEDIIVVSITKTDKGRMSDAYWCTATPDTVINTLQAVIRGIKNNKIEKVKI